MQTVINLDEIWYSGFFGVADDYKSELSIPKLKISGVIWQIKMQKEKSYAMKGSLRRHLSDDRYTVQICMRVFWIGDCESDLRFFKFNMADQR